ncbi:MAG: hypothetical protein H7X86_03545 [Gorillibacterium sp.]|nr:hypothetical protein [Gorillibacterium sp.]
MRCKSYDPVIRPGKVFAGPILGVAKGKRGAFYKKVKIIWLQHAHL